MTTYLSIQSMRRTIADVSAFREKTKNPRAFAEYLQERLVSTHAHYTASGGRNKKGEAIGSGDATLFDSWLNLAGPEFKPHILKWILATTRLDYRRPIDDAEKGLFAFRKSLDGSKVNMPTEAARTMPWLDVDAFLQAKKDRTAEKRAAKQARIDVKKEAATAKPGEERMETDILQHPTIVFDTYEQALAGMLQDLPYMTPQQAETLHEQLTRVAEAYASHIAMTATLAYLIREEQPNLLSGKAA
jgi:hypothetical protein